MAVTIGTVTLDHVLSWVEDDTEEIPVKKVVRKTTPTTQSQYFTVYPRMIDITARCTRVTKDALRVLQNQHSWQPLCDYDCVGACNVANPAFVDYVWMEKVKPEWQGDRDKNTPWHITMTLICSAT